MTKASPDSWQGGLAGISASAPPSLLAVDPSDNKTACLSDAVRYEGMKGCRPAGGNDLFTQRRCTGTPPQSTPSNGQDRRQTTNRGRFKRPGPYPLHQLTGDEHVPLENHPPRLLAPPHAHRLGGCKYGDNRLRHRQRAWF